MVCVYCSKPTRVVNSRERHNGSQVWRRRACSNCKAVFTTRESVEQESALMVNHGASVEPFLRDKLFLSIYDSLRHRKAPINEAIALTDTVIVAALPQFDNGSIDTSALKEIVLQTLANFDSAAGVHFKAYYAR